MVDFYLSIFQGLPYMLGSFVAMVIAVLITLISVGLYGLKHEESKRGYVPLGAFSVGCIGMMFVVISAVTPDIISGQYDNRVLSNEGITVESDEVTHIEEDYRHFIVSGENFNVEVDKEEDYNLSLGDTINYIQYEGMGKIDGKLDKKVKTEIQSVGVIASQD